MNDIRTTSNQLQDAERQATSAASRYARTDSQSDLAEYNAAIARIQAATAAYHDAVARVALFQLGNE